MENGDEIVIARIARAWGIRGEVTADLVTDFPERFAGLDTVTLRRGDERRQATIERFRLHQRRILLKFAGIGTMTDAEPLRGWDVIVGDDQLFPLPEGEDLFYDFDLVGCDVVTTGGETVGAVASVLRTGAGELLSVLRPDGRESLIPFVDDFCPEVDIAARRIVISPPVGLLDL